MCPYYLLCGMSYEQFWYASPYLVITYRKLHDMRIQQKNEELWLQGLYNFHAFSTALSNLNFSGKSKPANKYMDKPIDILPKTESEKKTQANIEKKKIVDNLKAWQQAMVEYGRRIKDS